MTNVRGSTFSGVAHPRPSKSFLHIDKSCSSSLRIMFTLKASTALDYDTQYSQFSHNPSNIGYTHKFCKCQQHRIMYNTKPACAWPPWFLAIIILLMNLYNIMHTYTCPHRSAALHYQLSWSQCWCCRGYVYHHLPGVFLHWSPAGYTHHLLLCQEGEEQWTATPLLHRGPPACPSVWWCGSRQAEVERECCVWSSGHTGDEAESLIWSCATLVR